MERRRGAWRAGCVLAAVLVAAPLAAAELEVTAGAAHGGSYGLELTVGATCTWAQDVVVEPPPSDVQGTFEACRTVTARDVRVAGSGAIFRAGWKIRLQNGFSVAPGVSFTADSSPGVTGDFAWVRDDTPSYEDTYKASFALRLDGLSLALGDEIEHLVGYSPSGDPVFRLVLRGGAGGQKLLAVDAVRDDGTWAATAPGSEITVPSGWNIVAIDWLSAYGSGQLLVALNGGPAAGLTAVDNGLQLVDHVLWGAVDGSVSTTSGVLHLDSFDSVR